jgi:hypothetical protein
MQNKVLDKLMDLMAKGYEVQMIPDNEGWVQIRLQKDNYRVARITRPTLSQQVLIMSYEDWFLYELNRLEKEYEHGVKELEVE